MKVKDGAGLCARYAFAPNFYRYCGPDKNKELAEYIKEQLSDRGLVENLAKFETLYPYLQVIATANGIGDPLDWRVVEAYWVGNELLEQMSMAEIYEALAVGQKLTKRLPKKEWGEIGLKVDRRARLHHSFHVLNIFVKTGYRMRAETVETMDECRISWGKILNSSVKSKMSKLKIRSQKLIYRVNKLVMVPAIKEVVVVEERLGRELKLGDWVSVHWGMVCDKLTLAAVAELSRYTKHHLKLANESWREDCIVRLK